MKLPRLLALQLCTYLAPQQDMLAHDGKTRKSGQALLLAVLLMLFAALLGATFVTVVAFNLSQTARNESKKSAEAAAQAGVRMANDRLVNSAEGENWRPNLISPPPAPGTPEFNTYYTPFEKAQGWADRRLVKFPDPRLLTAGSKDTPTYLLNVTPITQVTDPNYGLLRVEVIGRSDDNDAAFYRQVVYKGTSVGGGPFSFPVWVANYDTSKKTLRATTTTATVVLAGSGNTETATVTVRDASLFFRGQTVILSQSDSPTARRHGGVISDVNTTNNQVTVRFFASTTGFTYPVNSQLRAAATLMHNLLSQTSATDMSAASLDGDGNRRQGASYLTQLFVPPTPSANGLYFGGGLLLDGKGQVNLPADDEITVSGPVLKARTVAAVKINNSTDDLPESKSPRTVPSANQVVDIPNSEDGVPVLAPPSLGGTDGKYTRYLNLTRDADRDAGSQYGYGPGVYINNSDDVERVRVQRNMGSPATTVTTYRVLDNWEMQRLWTRKSFPTRTGEAGNIDNPGTNARTGYSSGTNNAHRLTWPRADESNTGYFPAAGSLEEQGRRGWISPWEFLPRGTLIELNAATNIITITRDSYSDSYFADPEKAWRNSTGGVLIGRYAMTIEPTGAPNEFKRVVNGVTQYTGPFNGVLFAEGNVRVRGTVGNKDITIVTKGNLYIEGNIKRTGTGRIALLAKRNVVVNPTQVITRSPDVHSFDAPSLTSTPIVDGTSTNTVTITPRGVARVGDRIRLGTGNVWRNVTAVVQNGSQDDITFDGAAYANSTGAPQTLTLQLLADIRPAIQNGAWSRALTRDTDIFVRNVKAINANGNYYLTTRHGGGARLAFNFVRRNTVKWSRLMPPDPLAPLAIAWLPNPTASTIAGNLNIKDPTSTTSTLIEPAESLLVSTESPSNNPEFSLNLFQLPDGPVLGDKGLATVGGPPYTYTYAGGTYTPTGTYGNDGEQNLNKLAAFLPQDFPDPGIDPGSPVPLWAIDALQTTYDDPITASPRHLMGNTPARRLARMQYANVAPGELRPAYLTTSVGVHWNPDFLGGGGINPWWQIGSAPQYDNQRPERFDSVDVSFYTSSSLSWQTGGATAPATTPITNDERVVFTQDRSDTVYGILAPYYLSTLRLERPQGAGASAWEDATNFTPNFDIQIEATIFAEEGSWFVIPAPMNQPETAVPDSTRYRRLNYNISVTGTIAQNFTPTAVEDIDNEVSPDAELDDKGTPSTLDDTYISRGAMAQWIDACARPGKVESNIGDNWLSITYNPDPLEAGEGADLKLPVSPDWTYVG